MRLVRPATLAIVLSSLFWVGCGRSHETATGGNTDAAGAPAPDLDGLKVEFRSVEIPAHMAPGSEVRVQIETKNVGTKSWPRGGDFPLVFGYHWEAPGADGNWAVLSWDDSNRGVLQADVSPGETVTVILPLKALPRACPNCRVVIAPLLEMKTWSTTQTSIATVNIS